MNRLSIVICLATSSVALCIAGFALRESGARGAESPVTQAQDHREMRKLVDSLERRVGELEARQERFGERAAKVGEAASGADVSASGEAAGVREQVEALGRRLAVLEDGETIARLAESGQMQLAESEIGTALDQMGDPGVSPDIRVRAAGSLRRLSKTHRPLLASIMGKEGLEERDIVLPMVELAQDTRLDGDVRAEAVRNLIGTRVEEVRRPLLGMLTSDAIPGVRQGALEALLYHLDDRAVRETISQVSRQEPDESIRARAEECLPKVQYFERMAADAAAGPAAGKEK